MVLTHTWLVLQLNSMSWGEGQCAALTTEDCGLHHCRMQSQGVMAMMRHYIGNEGETGRQWTSSNFDDRTAHELYVWPFQDAVHAGVVSTMCAYNGLNGTYSCADPISLGKWLHEELNYQGWVLSDFGSVYENTEVDSANAGLDSVIGATTPAFGREGDRLPSECVSKDGLRADAVN